VTGQFEQRTLRLELRALVKGLLCKIRDGRVARDLETVALPDRTGGEVPLKQSDLAGEDAVFVKELPSDKHAIRNVWVEQSARDRARVIFNTVLVSFGMKIVAREIAIAVWLIDPLLKVLDAKRVVRDERFGDG